MLEFDERSVAALLAEADVPVWTTRRPEILIWILAEDESGDRRLVGDEEETGVLSDHRR